MLKQPGSIEIMDEWEYLLDPVRIEGDELQMDEVNGTMNSLGSCRWELVAFTPLPQLGTFMCCYKRRKDDSGSIC